MNREIFDENGNAACNTCGKMQSSTCRACTHCCKHDELKLTEEWQGDDQSGRWGLNVECSACGKNYGFGRDELIRDYKMVRKTPDFKAGGAFWPSAADTG